MINGFEEQTVELTNDEIKTIVPIFIRGLNSHIGKQNAITNKEIILLIETKYQIKLKDSRVRKIIHYIRINRLVPKLCATSNGYYVAQSKKEHYEWIESIKQRLNSIQDIYNNALNEYHNE